MKFPGQRAYPKTIRVNEDIWHIKFVRKVPERHYGKEVIWGLCDPGEFTIYIKQGQTREQTFSTFVHEVLHAIEASYDFHIDKTDAHPKIYAIELAIVQLLRDNF
jgi:hypothetical protein